MAKHAFPTPGLRLKPSDGPELTLNEPLGAGAFGVVFKATSDEGTVYAVKFPQAGVFGTDREMNAFLNEINAAKQLEHEHVLQVVAVEAAPEESPPFIVMEYADGGTLKGRLDDARRADALLEPDHVLGWARQLIAGMEAINAEMLHRDLKPDNVLFRNGVLKISDFGLSKLVGAATRTQTFKGGQHLLYMAPEAWQGERNEIQVDMYALGIVLFEIATLTYPYTLPKDNAEISEFRDMHLYQAPRSMSAVRKDLPQQFSDAVDKLLSKRPQDRYRLWTDVAQALEAVQHERAIDPLMERAIAAAAERHRQGSAKAAEEEAKREEGRQARQLDEYQRDRLKERLKALVDEFNSRSELAKIGWQERGRDHVEMTIPNGGSASIMFFGFSPFDARSGEVRYGALVTDARGCGYNMLLRRHPATDIYGEWVVCRIRANPLTSRHPRGCKYFGLPASEIQEIPRGIRAMHVIIPEIDSDVEGAFRQLILSLAEEA